ncbi:MAG TPA: DUF1559 domain-containing protein [Chthonomonadaceae bacterium]|nr:DUF1559 domain-containing protein [Chthonomonadaceae bacterium]
MHTKSRAFTLIELLVVIAIIAILAAILFPVFAQAREKARAISCVSNEKQIALGVLMYIQDYDETFPIYWYRQRADGSDDRPSDDPFSPGVPDRMFGWNEAIYPYVKNVQLFRCPDAPRASTLTSIGSGVGGVAFNDDAPTGATGYALNARISGNTGYLDDGNTQHPPLNDAALEFAANTIMIVEASSNCSDGCSTSDENEWGWQGRHVDLLYGDGWIGGSDPGAAFIQPGFKPPLARHNGGANYAFSDGHVKFLNAGAMGLVQNPTSTDQVERSAGVALGFTAPLTANDSNTGQKPTYCPNSNCQYNVPTTP